MLLRWPRSWAFLLCLVLCMHIVLAERVHAVRRQDASTTTTTAAPKTTTETGKEYSTTMAWRSRSTTDTATAAKTTTSASDTVKGTAMPSAINDNAPTSTLAINSTIVEGELPLEPRLTPAYAVAGVILLSTGVVHTLGIKRNLLHTFLSAAYLASLCTTVLIVYIMSPPVSDGIQGAYLVAVVCTGLVLGGGATMFKEITEGLGCLLGGFCFSMWLLTLHQGGLLTSTGGKIIFITAFTVVGFATYFSRWTRIYALIGFTSFTGSTTTVLGIDCFSRGGLKEFWAYIWALNDDLFPLGADTYPLTKGIRVEIALTVIFCLIGLVSQLKLWKMVQERRAKRAEAQAELKRELDVEEANVGMQVEEQNARERQEWEASYGRKPNGSVTRSGDSGVGDMSENYARDGQTTNEKLSTTEAIEMTDFTPNSPNPSTVPTKQSPDGNLSADESRVTIKTGGDELDSPKATAAGQDDKVWVVGTDGETRPISDVSIRDSQRMSRSTVPEVVPLPFTVPNDVDKDDDDGFSVAAVADDDSRSVVLSERGSRNSLGKRLSAGSGNLLRSLSRHSHMSLKPTTQEGNDASSPQPSPTWGGSQEDLMVEQSRVEGDDASVAATFDDLSKDGLDNLSIMKDGRTRWSMDIMAELADPEGHAEENPSLTAKTTEATPDSGQTPIPIPTTSEDTPDATKVSKSVAATEESAPQSLTKERLPPGLSRVALSYRTNEWAKHLSQAELPESERLQLYDDVAGEESSIPEEAAAPVNVESLQQTAQTGAPGLVVARSSSSFSSSPASISLSRANSGVGADTTISATARQGFSIPPTQDLRCRNSVAKATLSNMHTSNSFRTKSGNQSRRTSADIIVQPIAEEHGDERPSDITNQLVEESNSKQSSPASSRRVSLEQRNSRAPIPGVVSYSSPQTLLGQREVFLRNKPRLSLTNASPPERGSYSPQPQITSDIVSPMHGSYLGQNADDIPLSQRKQIMRQSSLLQMAAAGGGRPGSKLAMTPTQQITTDGVPLNSYQPHIRRSTRESQLASFRQSVTNDLRAVTPVQPAGNTVHDCRLPSNSRAFVMQHAGRDGEVRRSVDPGWSKLLKEREQEAQQKEAERYEKERYDRAFEQRMRRGNLTDAHREAMRKMQNAAHIQ